MQGGKKPASRVATKPVIATKKRTTGTIVVGGGGKGGTVPRA
jgi:hypothetical protein